MEYPGDLLLHLESFTALLAEVKRGKSGAFDQCARKLGVDRSVLRRRMRTLDAWIGTPLLAGRGAALMPSPAGQRLAERAERLLAGVRELRADLTRERVTIGCTGTITTELLPRVLVSLEKRAKPVQLVVKRAGGALCESLLASGDIDLGVVRADEAPKNFAHRRLTDDRLWFVLPATHELAKAKAAKLTHAQMASVPLVLYGESSRTRARVMERLAPHGAQIRIEVEGRAAALEYVRAGIGATFLSLLPGHSADLRKTHALDVTTQFPRSRFYAIARHDRWDDPLIRDVVAELLHV